jgi:hypothetical protein
MKTSALRSGVCVSCGRASGPKYRACPYCGERVWLPAWRRAGRLALLAVPPALVAGLARWAWTERTAVADLGAWGGFLLAAGAWLALLPCRDDDLVVSSRRELRLWQAQAAAGGVCMGLGAAVAAAAVKGAVADAGVWALALLLGACVCAAPALYRIPWRALAGAALIAAGIAAG